MGKQPKAKQPSGGAWPRLAAAAVLLIGSMAAWAVWSSGMLGSGPAAATSDQAAIDALLRWVEARGGKMHPSVFVGKACPTCPRGVFAREALKRGDVVMSVPFDLALPVSHRPQSDDILIPEYARDLAVRLHTDPALNATWGAYWATLPRPEELFGPEVFTDAHLAMLQHPGLAAGLRDRREVAEAVYRGTFGKGRYPPLAGEAPISLRDFQHLTLLVKTRAFGAFSDGAFRIDSLYLMPLVDLQNTGPTPNAQKIVWKGGYHMIVDRPIPAGEEVLVEYNQADTLRPDRSLFSYGFVPALDRPLLCMVDLPPGFPSDSPVDPPYGDPASQYATQAEYDRLAAALAAAPTTEAEDQAALGSGRYPDWRDQTLLLFRIQRKRALRQTLQTLAAALAGGGRPAGSSGGSADARVEL